MRTGRPKMPLEVSGEDREKLNLIARRVARQKSPPQQRLRVRGTTSETFIDIAAIRLMLNRTSCATHFSPKSGSSPPSSACLENGRFRYTLNDATSRAADLHRAPSVARLSG